MNQLKPVLTFKSHIAGKNAEVNVWPDRIEWSRTRVRAPGGVTGAVLTGGLSLLATSARRDTNTIPIRMIQGVTTHRGGGFGWTIVKVATAGAVIEFQVSKRDAETVKQTITSLMLGGPPATPASVSPSAAPAASVADELRKLAELRDAGVLSEEEFAAQKARLLGS